MVISSKSMTLVGTLLESPLKGKNFWLVKNFWKNVVILLCFKFVYRIPDDEDIIMMEDDELNIMEPVSSTDSLSRKRKALDPVEENAETPAKRICAAENSDDVEIL